MVIVIMIHRLKLLYMFECVFMYNSGFIKGYLCVLICDVCFFIQRSCIMYTVCVYLCIFI